MRKSLKLVLLLVAGFVTMMNLSAQNMPIPADKDVRIGKLPNGLTYYIRHNETPKGQADFYIAQKVGSILEEDNQRGLAHFLEHMCFNGTKNFPGNGVISWLESVGVKFGQNLNAYTSIDETVYNISNVPTDRISVQDSCLLILHDWANDLTLDPKEIDKERGVIHEEWRTNDKGQMRILNTLLPKIYPGSKYGYRMPIGTLEVIDNFPYQALRDYYETWYRPDQQGVIVVGDIDVDRIESKIKEIFSPIEMPANAKERVYLPVEDNKGTIYAIGADKEMSYPIAQMMFKTDVVPDSLRPTLIGVTSDYIADMIATMLNQRLIDISSKPEAPFAQAFANYSEFLVAKTKNAFTVTVLAKGGDIVPGIEGAYREILRAVQGGFTIGEYERAQKEYLSRIEKAYNDRENHQTEAYVQDYVRNFIDNTPMPSLEDEYQLMNMIVPNIPVDAINMTMKELIKPDNRVFMVMMPEKEGYIIPTEEAIATAITKVDAEKIEAYVDEVKSEPLIAALPAHGKITKIEQNNQWGAEKWTLSNGATVWVKKTNFKNDEILFSAIANGGLSALSEAQAANAIFLPMALSQAGLGTYTNSDLKKYLQGKQAEVGFSFDNNFYELSGKTTPKDLPTLMELIYMNMTNVTMNDDDYKAITNQLTSLLKAQETNPQYTFQKFLTKSLYKSAKKQALTVETINAADRQGILDIVKKATDNAAGYNFYFVGNVDTETLKPLVEQYIASLPSSPKDAITKTMMDPSLAINSGTEVNTTTTAMETPQTWVGIFVQGKLPYTAKNHKAASIAGQILSKRLLETVREKEGAVYSIGASGAMTRVGDYNTFIQTAFPMKPELKDKVLGMIKAEMNAMTSNITEDELKSVKEYMLKNFTENKELNSPWLNAMLGANINGVDTFNNTAEVLNGITVKDVQKLMNDLLKQNNYRTVILDPAK